MLRNPNPLTGGSDVLARSGVTSHNDRTGRLAVYASTCAHVCNDVLPLGEALRRGVLESCAAWDGGITIEANFESASSLQFENLQSVDVLKVFPFGMQWFGNESAPLAKANPFQMFKKCYEDVSMN